MDKDAGPLDTAPDVTHTDAMSNIDKIIEVSQRVVNLRTQLAAAEKELAAFTGPNSRLRAAAPTRRRPIPIRGRGTVGPSVSQRVLNMVVDAGRTGVARRDILAIIPNEAAVHSALKAHQTAGRIENDKGQWLATAGYVNALQSVPAESTQRETRPMRIPQSDAFITGQG